ncbi:hypothetical protein ACFL9U_06445 [Thermodesulfobacteriota bacterium]
MQSDFQYVPMGMKLNMMYASIPPRYYRNLHNFNEYNAPRIDIGMLTGSLYERSIYGFNSTDPQHAQKFYLERKAEVYPLVLSALSSSGAISSSAELSFPEDFAEPTFVPPSVEVDLGSFVPEKHYALFVYYGANALDQFPYLRVITRRLVRSGTVRYRWNYHEFRLGIGVAPDRPGPFLAGPMFVACFGGDYSRLEFNQDDPNLDPIYREHSSYYQTKPSVRQVFQDFIERETVIPPNQYGQVIVKWDGKIAPRTIVASQPYYDWDDDLQSAQIEALLDRRLAAVEAKITKLMKGLVT